MVAHPAGGVPKCVSMVPGDTFNRRKIFLDKSQSQIVRSASM